MNKFMLMIFFLFLLVLGYAYVCNDDTRVMKEKIGILKHLSSKHGGEYTDK